MIRNICVQYFFVHLVALARLKLFRRTGGFFLLCLVHASEMPEEQLLREARQFLLQEIELSSSVDLPTLEAQRVRDHMILYLYSVFFTKYEMGSLFHLRLHLKSFLVDVAEAVLCIHCTCAPPQHAESLLFFAPWAEQPDSSSSAVCKAASCTP